ncbi:unnamed protein product [Caretta caretta]
MKEYALLLYAIFSIMLSEEEYDRPVPPSTWEPTRTSDSAPPILAKNASPYNCIPIQTTNLKKNFLRISLLEGLKQPLERPSSVNGFISKCFKTYPEKSKILVQPSPQCILKEEGEQDSYIDSLH